MYQPELYSMLKAGYYIQTSLRLKNPNIRMKYRHLDQVQLDKSRSFVCKGIFKCYECKPKHEWGSTNVTIEIGLTITDINPEYISFQEAFDNNVISLHQFSFRAYKQRCVRCQTYCKPKLDDSNLLYLEKTVSNYLECARGKGKRKEYGSKIDNAQDKHMEELCEACQLGRCAYQVNPQRQKENKKGKKIYREIN